MRFHRLCAVVGLSVFGMAACVQPPDPSQETTPNDDTDTRPDELAPLDFGDLNLGGGLDLGGGLNLGFETDPSGLRSACYGVAKSGREVREQFCQRVPQDKRGACWSHVHDSPVSWINWCTWTF